MADDQGLFGPTPFQIQQAQLAQQQTAAQQYAQQTPLQRAAAGMFTGGGQAVNAVAPAMGLVNPQQQMAQQTQDAVKDLDVSTPEGMLQAAQRLQSINPNLATALAAKAREAQVGIAKAQQEAATARQKDALALRESSMAALADARAEALAKSDQNKNLPPAIQAMKELAAKDPTYDLQGAIKQWILNNPGGATETSPTSVKEFQYAVTNDGYKGTYQQWLKEKAQATHIIVNTGGAVPGADTVEFLAQQYVQSGTLPPLGMGKDAAAMRAAVLARAAQLAGQQAPTTPGGTPPPVSATDAAASVIANKQTTASQNKAVSDFSAGPTSKKVTAINTAVNHLQTMDELTDSLSNTDPRVFNMAANAFAKATGAPAPTNFAAAKQLVAAEVIKAIVQNGGGAKEREEAAANFDAANSPAQLHQVAQTYRSLLGGQLQSLQQQYTTSTGRPLTEFNKKLLPNTLKAVSGASTPAATSASDFNAQWATLPSGKSLVGPDGKTYTKK